jgi:hypothetical protein
MRFAGGSYGPRFGVSLNSPLIAYLGEVRSLTLKRRKHSPLSPFLR